MSIRCWPDLVRYGVDETIQREFGEWISDEGVEEGFNVTLKLDMDNPTPDPAALPSLPSYKHGRTLPGFPTNDTLTPLPLFSLSQRWYTLLTFHRRRRGRQQRMCTPREKSPRSRRRQRMPKVVDLQREQDRRQQGRHPSW